MTNKLKMIIVGLAALVVGLMLGYLFFGSSASSASTPQETKVLTPREDSAEQTATWTCSMHPQIRQEGAGDCPICGMDLIPLSENTSNDPLVLQMTPEAVKLANVQTTVVGQQEATTAKTLRLSGKVQADERLAASQVTHISGRIEKLYVSFVGEQIRGGQRLAELYSPDLISAQRELIEAKRMEALNPELVAAARDKLRNWKIPASTIADIAESEVLRETFTIYADIGGVVTERKVAVGDYVQRGEVLFELLDLSQLWVLFDAYEEDLPHIQLGSKVTFTTPAIPEQRFTGRVSFIDPFINPQTRVATVRLEVNNRGAKLKPEMLVYGTLEQAVRAGETLTVPKSAVLWTGPRSVVYVKMPELPVPSFQFREVQLGERLGDSYEIIDGLAAGEEVVTYGNFAIDAAAQLNNQASMMNREVVLKTGTNVEVVPDFTTEVPVAFKQQLVTVVEAYLSLKDALVNDDPATATAAATAVETQLGKVDMSLLTGMAHQYWMEQHTALSAHLKGLEETATELAAQRQQFDFLSQALIKSLQAFGISAGTFFVQYCPMAFDNEGAAWLSSDAKIRNPYFGDQMLTCGYVKDTIDKNY